VGVVCNFCLVMQNEQIVDKKIFTQQLDKCGDSVIINLFWQNIFAGQSGTVIFSEFLRAFSPFNSSPSKENIGDLFAALLTISPCLQIRNMELALFVDKRMRIRISTLAEPIKTLVFYIIQHASRYFGEVRDTFGFQNIVLLNCKYPMPLKVSEILGFYMTTISKLCEVNAPEMKICANILYSSIVNYLLQRLVTSKYAHEQDWFSLFNTHCPRNQLPPNSPPPVHVDKNPTYFL
jgi:hypothetical protein